MVYDRIAAWASLERGLSRVVKNMPVLVDASGEPLTPGSTETRNFSYSNTAHITLPIAQWNTWTVSSAVRDGMKSNNWVFLCVNLIVKTLIQLDFRVQDISTKEFVDVPEIDNLLQSPNPAMSRNDTFELIASWMLLSGRAYLWFTEKNLWPISPDRLSPVRDSAFDSLLKGYAKISADGAVGTTIELKPDEVIPFLLLNPADPVDGLSPLQAVGKQVDIDNEQASFNKSAMQNRGELSGFISFDEMMTQEQIDAYSEKVNNRYSGANNSKKIGILGAGAKYQRIGATPVEMDFQQSSISTRDKIISTFGVPPQLVGAQEASTYDNVKTAELLLWRNTVLPFADNICDSLTFFFFRAGILKQGQKIAPDTSSIMVLQEQLEHKTVAAKDLYAIGVPVSQISRMLNIGVEEYSGWDAPYNGSSAPAASATKPDNRSTQRLPRSNLRSNRDVERELRNADDRAESFAKDYEELLEDQKASVFAAIYLGNATASEMVKILKASRKGWQKLVASNYTTQAGASADDVVIGGRSKESMDAINDYLENEEIILREVGLIEGSTLGTIMMQITDGMEQGLSPSAIQQNITDVSAFSASRALRISRTVTGTAQSIGLFIGARVGGATTKIWSSSFDTHVRDVHRDRNGEEAPIDEVFSDTPSSNGAYPMYPLDPNLSPGDRVNCRCSMTFRA